jgi:hypothetical protein
LDLQQFIYPESHSVLEVKNMTQKQRTANFKNVSAKVCIPTIDNEPQSGSMVVVRGKGPIDVFVHYDEDGTFRSASVWNGTTWINI